MKRGKSILFLTQGALIAALYVVVTELCSLVGLSSGIVQFRLSEALCVLSAFTPAAIPALGIGCLISNIFAGGIPLDILFGAVASLLGALGGYLLRKWWYLVPLPTVVANVLIIPPILKFAYNFEGALAYFALTVGIGEVVCAYIGGLLLYKTLLPHRHTLFPSLD